MIATIIKSNSKKFRILLKQTMMLLKRYLSQMKYSQNPFLHAGTVEAQIIPPKGRSEGDIVQLGTFIVKCATKEDILKVVVMLIKLLQMMKASV